MTAHDPPNAEADIAEQNRTKLIEEFGSLLDESLIFLIANERDVVRDYADIRSDLSQLAETARAEAATGFDPSGLSSLPEIDGLRLDETTTSGKGPDSSGEYLTSISEFSDYSEQQSIAGHTNLSDEEKVQELKLIFQERWKDHTLTLALKRNQGDLDRTFDDLLNRQYLEESESLPKGLDAFFFDPQDDPQSNKGKSGRARKGRAKSKKQVLPVNYRATSATVDDSELEGAKDFAQATLAPGKQRLAPPTFPRLPSPTTTATTTTTASPTTPNFGAASRRAAAALRRMGPLGRQGAVVYTDRAWDEVRATTAQASRLAEAHVAAQSTATTVDLHGVFVMDGVRIARQRVWAWWNGGGGREEEEQRRARRLEGFTVVTGVGKHSAGGVSRLRQAVGAYLRNDGWRVETLTGSFYVTGRV